jgi:excisionase family DNA binding protein
MSCPAATTGIPATPEPTSGSMLPDPTVEPTLSVERTAELLGVSRGLAYQAVHRGQLPVLRIGRRLRVPTAPLLRLLGSDHAANGRRQSAEGPMIKGAGANAAAAGENGHLSLSRSHLPVGWPQRCQGPRR